MRFSLLRVTASLLSTCGISGGGLVEIERERCARASEEVRTRSAAPAPLDAFPPSLDSARPSDLRDFLDQSNELELVRRVFAKARQGAQSDSVESCDERAVLASEGFFQPPMHSGARKAQCAPDDGVDESIASSTRSLSESGFESRDLLKFALAQQRLADVLESSLRFIHCSASYFEV